ncbi:MAG: PqqD family peptide modification chaperone [bacterium]|nr:PqqD family peptide modification chaperone [bacterium]
MDPLHSPSWYRVAELRPRLSSQVRFGRHMVRGQCWYVARHPTTGNVHRLAPAAHALVEQLDGECTTQAAWEAVAQRFGDDAPTQDEALQLLGVLHGAGFLRGDLPPDTAALFERVQEEERQEARSQRNPVSFRVPLLDPDAFLERWLWCVQPIFSRAGALLTAGVILAAAVAALQHLPELVAAGDSVFEPESVLALWFTYPLVKVVHELGHAFAVKRWGGDVHEIGVMFLVFLPVPYVDASASAVFPEKHRRMLVSAAGIGVELLLASLALFVWLVVEPGFVRHVAYAVMLVGGISTLLFNGNPLLRFDGYYVLADAIEIPNLAARGQAFVGALVKQKLLGLRETRLPETAPGETPWLVGYAIASTLYQLGVMLGIALYLAGQFFVLGVALAVFTLLLRVGVPLVRHGSWLLTDPSVGERRGRALLGGGGLLVAALVAVFIVPVPLHTHSPAVTWLPERAHVRAAGEGFVVEVLAEPHRAVRAGDPLFRIRDPLLEARRRAAEARWQELRQELQAFVQKDRVRTEIARERLAGAEAALNRLREQAREEVIRSPLVGMFLLEGGRDWVGRYVRQGDLLGYVLDLGSATARVVVSQDDVALIRERTREVGVRMAHAPTRELPGRIVREVPAAGHRLPTAALGTAGGGPLAVDPADPDGLRTLEPMFQFDLELPPGHLRAVGEFVHVRFDHGAEPVGLRAFRSLRRLFLRQLGV